MYNLLIKRGTTISFAVALLLVVAFLATAIPGASGVNFEDMPSAEKMQQTTFDIGIGSAIIMSIVAFALAFVVFGLLGLIKNPKSAVGLIGGLVAIAALYFVGQSFGGEPSAQLSAVIQKFDISESTSGLISGAMFTGIVLSVLSFIAIALGELKGLFS